MAEDKFEQAVIDKLRVKVGNNLTDYSGGNSWSVIMITGEIFWMPTIVKD